MLGRYKLGMTAVQSSMFRVKGKLKSLVVIEQKPKACKMFRLLVHLISSFINIPIYLYR